MESQKIAISEGPDIIRWGYKIKWMFTIQEGYYLQATHHHEQGPPIWDRIWQEKLWPKISFFLWIIRHGRALTWDQIQIKELQGPLAYFTCGGHSESMEHLTNACSYSEVLWKNHEKLFVLSNTDQTSMKPTMDKWRRKPYQNPILSHA